MADPCRVFIDAVHAKLALLHGAAVPYVVGAKKWHANGAPPLVKWARGFFDHDIAKTTGGDVAPIYTRNQTLLIRVWSEATKAEVEADEDASEEAVDALFNNLIRAVRFASGVNELRIGRFSWITEDKPGWLNRGAALEGFIVTDLPLPASPSATVRVTIQSQTHTQKLDPP